MTFLGVRNLTLAPLPGFRTTQTDLSSSEQYTKMPYSVSYAAEIANVESWELQRSGKKLVLVFRTKFKSHESPPIMPIIALSLTRNLVALSFQTSPPSLKIDLLRISCHLYLLQVSLSRLNLILMIVFLVFSNLFRLEEEVE